MMGNWVIYALLIAAMLVLLVFLRFGAKTAAAVGAAFALLLAFFLGQRGAKTKIENEQLRDRVKNDDKREEAEQRANAAADTVRNLPADELRQSDSFERR